MDIDVVNPKWYLSESGAMAVVWVWKRTDAATVIGAQPGALCRGLLDILHRPEKWAPVFG